MKTSSVISQLPSTAVVPTSQMVLRTLPLRAEISDTFNQLMLRLIEDFVVSFAEASMTEDYHVEQSDGKRYSVDPGDSAFSSVSSPYSPKSSYGFRSSQQFSNSSASMNMCRMPSTSPSTFPEGNRTGEKSPQDKTDLYHSVVRL